MDRLEDADQGSMSRVARLSPAHKRKHGSEAGSAQTRRFDITCHLQVRRRDTLARCKVPC